jgi:hypothetical protein
MRDLPSRMVQVLASFAPLFSKGVWQHAQVLLIGAILAPGTRTVSSLPCAPWAWISRSASIATIECLAALAGRA